MSLNMNRLYQKNELLFAILWIIVYVIGFSAGDHFSAHFGIEKLVTVLVGAVLTAILLLWLYRNGLARDYGLCPSKVPAGKLLYYLPLVLLASVNLWFGVTMNLSLLETGCYIIAMFFVGLLEEVIFRGLLFKAVAKDNLKTATIVSSVTFGIGHIVNLFNGSGADLLGSGLQVVYAIAAGFMFTVLFYKTKSLLACIITHGCLNALSVFANKAAMTPLMEVGSAAVLTVVAAAYGWYIWKKVE